MRKLFEIYSQEFLERHISMLVVKYNTKFYGINDDGLSCYQKDEWTSVSDIGKVFEGVILTKEEYLRVEKQHIDAIIALKKFVKGDFVRLSYIFKSQLNKVPIFSNDEIRLLRTYRKLNIDDEYNNKEIIIDILKLSLRDRLGLPFLSMNNNEVLIDFRYDYYMSFWFRKIKNNEIFINNLGELKKQIEDLGLFADISDFKNRKVL